MRELTKQQFKAQRHVARLGARSDVSRVTVSHASGDAPIAPHECSRGAGCGSCSWGNVRAWATGLPLACHAETQIRWRSLQQGRAVCFVMHGVETRAVERAAPKLLGDDLAGIESAHLAIGPTPNRASSTCTVSLHLHTFPMQQH
eukprot:2719418-Pleurochrysis_carterae.AAC.2